MSARLEFCASCDHPRHDYGPCDVVKTSARLGWSSRCECSNYPAGWQLFGVGRQDIGGTRVTPYYDDGQAK